jgi:Tol biopolymer transport system component
VAFRTNAPDLGDGAGAVSQVVVVDRSTKKSVTVSKLNEAGDAASWLPTVSSNGREIAFVSSASNLVSGDTNGTDDVFRFELDSGKLSRLSVRANGAESAGTCSSVALSSSGDYAAFVSSADDLVSGDDNVSDDVFVTPLK